MNQHLNSVFVTVLVFVLCGCAERQQAGKTAPIKTPRAVARQTAHRFSKLEIASVAIEGAKVRIHGVTDLPDGSELSITFDVAGRLPEETYIGVDTKVFVRGGKFGAVLSIPKRPEFAKGSYVAEAFFTPIGQSASIVRLVGKDGERLESNDPEDLKWGFKTMKTSKNINEQVKIAAYPMVNPAVYSIDQPERALAEFVSAWKDRDWARMAEFTDRSPTLEASVAETVENDFGHRNLLGAEIVGKSRAEDVELVLKALDLDAEVEQKTRSGAVSYDIAIKVYFAIGAQINSRTITARVNRVDPSGDLSAQGTWGVNVTSALREQ